ncbi:MAG: thiamine diphosphokinase [Roseburia sp.]|nr:thiamine diphosphokinase [Roseburia sp.]
MARCILIGAGDLTVGEVQRRDEDYVIAVDGGLGYCGILGLEPDLILGDFDSVGEKEQEAIGRLREQIPDRIIRLNPMKDDTDMLYALKHALKAGYREFLIYGGTGGRFDHTLANIQCLLYLKNHQATGYLMDGNGMILVIKNEAVHFQKNLEGYLSLFSLGGKAEGVTIRGMKYNMENGVIANDFPIGISNEFTGEEAEISVVEGELVCMLQYVSD